jgi:hypothetical protein
MNCESWLVPKNELITDDRCFGIDQVGWCENLIVAHIHTLPDGAGHTGQPNAKLIVQLFANCTNTAVTEVVNIINFGTVVDQTNQIFDNGDNIFLGQNLGAMGISRLSFLLIR